MRMFTSIWSVGAVELFLVFWRTFKIPEVESNVFDFLLNSSFKTHHFLQSRK